MSSSTEAVKRLMAERNRACCATGVTSCSLSPVCTVASPGKQSYFWVVGSPPWSSCVFPTSTSFLFQKLLLCPPNFWGTGDGHGFLRPSCVPSRPGPLISLLITTLHRFLPPWSFSLKCNDPELRSNYERIISVMDGPVVIAACAGLKILL